MSQTTQTFLADEYLLSSSCSVPAPQPPAGLVVAPGFGTIQMFTPIGRLSYLHIAAPATPQQRSGQPPPVPRFSCSVLMNPAAVGDLWKAIVMVANNRWQPEERPNPQNPSQMVLMQAEHRLMIPQDQGGIANPLQNGNQTYSQDPVKYKAYLGTYVLNAGIDAVNRKSQKSQQPMCLDEDGHPLDPAGQKAPYSGCYGRLMINIFAYPKVGVQGIKPGISTSLMAVQFARHGERLGGFDVLRAAQAYGTLPKDMTAPPPGAAPQQGVFGPAGGMPFTPPAGGVPAGFASPPAQQQQPQAGPTFQPPGVGGGTVLPWNTPAA